MRYVLLATLAAFVIIWLLRSKQISNSKGSARANTGHNERLIGEQMMCCAHCGIHVPASEAVVAPSGLTFCSEEHCLRRAES